MSHNDPESTIMTHNEPQMNQNQPKNTIIDLSLDLEYKVFDPFSSIWNHNTIIFINRSIKNAIVIYNWSVADRFFMGSLFLLWIDPKIIERLFIKIDHARSGQSVRDWSECVIHKIGPLFNRKRKWEQCRSFYLPCA